MPSRIGSTKLTLRVPSQIAEDARVFCARHRITLAALTAEGLLLAMAEIGRPDGQTARRPTDQIDQIDRIDEIEKTDQIDLDRFPSSPSLSSHSAGRPDGQTETDRERALRLALSANLPHDTIETWFRPLTITLNANRRLLELAAPSHEIREWVDRNYQAHVRQALATVGLNDWTVKWDKTREPQRPTVTPPQPKTAADEEERLLQLYSVVTDNPVTDDDRHQFKKIAHCSPESVEAGILRSRLKASAKIRRFAYCTKAIQQIESANLSSALALELVSSLRGEIAQQPLLFNTLNFPKGDA